MIEYILFNFLVFFQSLQYTQCYSEYTNTTCKYLGKKYVEYDRFHLADPCDICVCTRRIQFPCRRYLSCSELKCGQNVSSDEPCCKYKWCFGIIIYIF